MEVLFLILNKTEYLDDILNGFVSIGIKGATILDSEGMGHALVESQNYDRPFFGSFKSLLKYNRPYNKVVFTAVEKELVPSAIKVIEDILGDLSKPGVGLVFTMPISNIYGITKLQNEDN
ncbi:MAG: P-II family nitrogen regulator [Peptoniphilaceae bacterium]